MKLKILGKGSFSILERQVRDRSPFRLNPTLKRKIIMRSKLTILFIALLGIQYSFSAYSQKINIKAENRTLDNILLELREQSGFKILYNTEAIRKVGRISVE